MSIKGLEDGTNVPFLSIREVIGWHAKQSQSTSKAPAVKVSVMLLFNNEVYDLLSQNQQRGKVRFKK